MTILSERPVPFACIGSAEGFALKLCEHAEELQPQSDPGVQSIPAVEEQPLLGKHFRSRGYYVDAVGLDEEMVRKYIKY